MSNQRELSPVLEAKKVLDKIISKGRAFMYKPIRIAEILHHHRIDMKMNLLDLESYRKDSKAWGDDISVLLNGAASTSSSKFNDDVFNDGKASPWVLDVLGQRNRESGGSVEAYIYSKIFEKKGKLNEALDYCRKSTATTFDVKRFIQLFCDKTGNGLATSIDKIYEIIVYALFSVLSDVLNVQVKVFMNGDMAEVLNEFKDFAKMVMCIDSEHLERISHALIFRVGVTNAADHGIDMYCNWGPFIQVKHITLTPPVAERITSQLTSDKIIIVCKDRERGMIEAVLRQIDWTRHIQSVITEGMLIEWYEKAMRGKYSCVTADKILEVLRTQITVEFPANYKIPDVLEKRHYEKISDSFWSE